MPQLLHLPDFKMLIAIQPNAPKCKTLRYAREELLEVEGIVPFKNLIKLGVDGVPASTEKILSSLSDISIAHFACHALQDIASPLESGLIVDKGKRLKISQFMEKQLQGAALVFLSACQTAMGDEVLPDEAIHIAASMLFVGFRSVVATMW
jgi:CHAT domain-containing protein